MRTLLQTCSWKFSKIFGNSYFSKLCATIYSTFTRSFLSLISFEKYIYVTNYGIPGKWEPGPGTSTDETQDLRRYRPRWDPGPRNRKWDPGPETPEPKIEPQIFQSYIVLIVYSTLNTFCTLLVTKLCINLLIILNLFYGKYTEAAITMCYKFQRIISSSLNFSEKLGKKTMTTSNLSSKVKDFKLATS